MRWWASLPAEGSHTSLRPCLWDTWRLRTPRRYVSSTAWEVRMDAGSGIERESSAGRLAHPPHLMRMVEACSVAAARGTAFVRSHCAPRITKVHSAAACDAPDAEPVCRINWIRRHGTFPSCRLRRKLHGPFSYVAGDAASYAWRHFDKTTPGHAKRGIPGAGKEIQERDLLRLQRHNV